MSFSKSENTQNIPTIPTFHDWNSYFCPTFLKFWALLYPYIFVGGHLKACEYYTGHIQVWLSYRMARAKIGIQHFNPCHTEWIKMSCPLLIVSQSDCLIRLFIRNHILNDKQCRSSLVAYWFGSTQFAKESKISTKMSFVFTHWDHLSSKAVPIIKYP